MVLDFSFLLVYSLNALKKPLLCDKNPKNSGYNALNIFINVQLFCQETKEVDLKKKISAKFWWL